MKKRLTASLLSSLTLLPALCPEAGAASTSYNTGSLGSTGDGSNTDTVVLDQPGAVAAGDDHSTGYNGGQRTTVGFLSALNPASSSPFTIEFWANPTGSDSDDVPVNNRVGSGNRSGWVFFQRAAATGWNFRMYNGNGSATGVDLTGGSSTLNAWSHVVATWDGSNARLYVNGSLVGTALAAVYNASTAAVFSVGALADGSSSFNGSVDEIAFYNSALTETTIHDHFIAAASPTPGAYSSLVLGAGALEYLQQNPPFVRIAESGANRVITFTGVLSQSTDLSPSSWTDLSVTSPYTVIPSAATPKLFFRSHR